MLDHTFPAGSLPFTDVLATDPHERGMSIPPAPVLYPSRVWLTDPPQLPLIQYLMSNGDSFNGPDFVASHVSLLVFAAIVGGFKCLGGGASTLRFGPVLVLCKTTWVTLENMDFTTGLRELDAKDEREQAKVASVCRPHG